MLLLVYILLLMIGSDQGLFEYWASIQTTVKGSIITQYFLKHAQKFFLYHIVNKWTNVC
jgi:hypothetical protein